MNLNQSLYSNFISKINTVEVLAGRFIFLFETLIDNSCMFVRFYLSKILPSMPSQMPKKIMETGCGFIMVIGIIKYTYLERMSGRRKSFWQ